MMPKSYILKREGEGKICKITLILKTCSGNVVHVNKLKYIVCECLNGSHICIVVWVGEVKDPCCSLKLRLDLMCIEEGSFSLVDQIQ